MGYVKLTGTANRHTDWTTEIVLERDEAGEVTKVVKAGVPVNLTADEQKKLEGLGYTFDDSSAEEAKEYEEGQATVQVGADVAGSAPTFAPAQDQPAPTPSKGADKGSDK